MTQFHLVAIVPEASAPAVPATARAETEAGWAAVRMPAPARPSFTRRAVAQAALARQRVMEALLTAGPVLPVAPHTGLACSEVAPLLKAHATTFAAQVTAQAGSTQFQLVLHWDERRALQHFASAPELAALRGATVSSAELMAAVAKLSDRLHGMVLATLDSVVADMIALPPPAGALANLALLVPPGAELALDTALERIDAHWPEGFRLQLIGPAPPISFALLHVERVSAAERTSVEDLLGHPLPWTQHALAERRRTLARSGQVDLQRLNRALAVATAAADLPTGAPLFLVDARREAPRALVPGQARAA